MNGRSDREQMLEQVALLALGVLPRAEIPPVAAFVAADDEARREYDALSAAAATIGVTAQEPVDSARSARMKERLMARVRADAAAGRSSSRHANAGWLWATGLAAAAALVLSVVTVAQDVSLRGELSAAQRRASTLQTQLAQTQRIGQRDRQMLTDLASADARRYPVPDGSVVVRGDRLYFQLTKLPPLPRGRVYQAWTAAKGSTTMQPSVTFAPNAEGVAVVSLPVDATKVGTVAVSVEPDGGSRAPTTKPAFVRPLT
ncbi:MAG: anti-sigma factor [Candidatus Eremiobacteraeota bacterium]|nr:anti-sigma factor [Candidatus Eremiobacteraeota bacterium]